LCLSSTGLKSRSQHFTLIHTTPLQFLVLWNGSEKNPPEIALDQDRNYLQGITATEIVFSKIIGTALKRVHHEAQ
jgi:hypothetical protein